MTLSELGLYISLSELFNFLEDTMFSLPVSFPTSLSSFGFLCETLVHPDPQASSFGIIIDFVSLLLFHILLMMGLHSALHLSFPHHACCTSSLIGLLTPLKSISLSSLFTKMQVLIFPYP